MNFLRSILPKKIYLKLKLYSDEVWEPFNYGKDKSCDGIDVGDYIAIEILNETTDYIYQIVYRKGGKMDANRRNLWKVIEKYNDDLMLQCGSSKIMLKYSEWTGDNVLTTPKMFMQDEASYAFFKQSK